MPKLRLSVDIPLMNALTVELPKAPESTVPFPSPGSVSMKYSAVVSVFGFRSGSEIFSKDAPVCPQFPSES